MEYNWNFVIQTGYKLGHKVGINSRNEMTSFGVKFNFELKTRNLEYTTRVDIPLTSSWHLVGNQQAMFKLNKKWTISAEFDYPNWIETC